MIPTDEFYSEPLSKKQELVDSGHVVVDGEIAETVPSPNKRGGVYVFDEPVADLIVDNLKGGRYTANELSPDFPIDKEELDDLLSWMKYKPETLLTEHFGVLRVANTEGSSYVYTIEAIPFAARCLDPTLSGYLLDSNDSCPISRPNISTKRSSKSRSEYLDKANSYWGIPEEEIENELDNQTGFAPSTLGPLPVVENLPNPENVVERFRSAADSYRRKRHTVESVKKNISYHKSWCRRNPSVGAFQSFSLYLMDISEYASIENDRQIRELATQGGQILFRCLYGNLAPGKSMEWQPFEVDIHDKNMSDFDRRVVDIVEQQPSSNSQLADRWGFDDGKDAWNYIHSRISKYATRNSESFICATESARQYVQDLEKNDDISISKDPPRIPTKRSIDLEVSEKQEEKDSGFDWSK
jgi:hypothetical protein